MTLNGIPPISDYAHWNEDAERVWYEENKYDMLHPEVFEDYLNDPYDERNWRDEHISEEKCFDTKRHNENINDINTVLLGPNGDIIAEEWGYCGDCEMQLFSHWSPQGYRVTADSMPMEYGLDYPCNVEFAVYEKVA